MGNPIQATMIAQSFKDVLRDKERLGALGRPIHLISKDALPTTNIKDVEHVGDIVKITADRCLRPALPRSKNYYPQFLVPINSHILCSDKNRFLEAYSKDCLNAGPTGQLYTN